MSNTNHKTTINNNDGGNNTPPTKGLDGIVEGTPGDDTIDAGYTGDPEGDMVDNSDNIFSSDPDDSEDDIIKAFDGNDWVRAGEGDDIIYAGDGNDTIIGGAGADTIHGGDGRDVIIGSNPGDKVDGGSGPKGVGADGMPKDCDTLDLSKSAPPGGSLKVFYTSPDQEDGYVKYFDDKGSLVGSSKFEDIEKIIVPCFTPGTTIATPTGERLIDDLHEGDRVITRDNGQQKIRWIGSVELTGHRLARSPHLRPILIQAGSLGDNLPEQDILVSPQHRVLLTSEKAQLYFEEREVLVAAKHLTHLDGIDEVGTLGVTYIHFMFDQHEVVLSNGAWTESFQPGVQTMDGLGEKPRSEIYELFPELETTEGLLDYAAARRSLKMHEARLLSR